MSEYVAQVWMETITCYKCQVHFAVPLETVRRLRGSQKSFWCPAGHEQHFTGKSEAQKLRDELARKDEVLAAEQARGARMRRERDEVVRAHKRMRTRVMNGVCPCCNRTFQNLLQHMKTEHSGEFNLRNIREAYGMTQAQLAGEIGVGAVHISLQERDKPVPEWAKHNIEAWVQSQDKVKA